MWRPNPGRYPDDCDILHPDIGEHIGFRKVHVRLFNGWTSLSSGPWPAAGGRPPTVWRISCPPHPFDIAEYLLSE